MPLAALHLLIVAATAAAAAGPDARASAAGTVWAPGAPAAATAPAAAPAPAPAAAPATAPAAAPAAAAAATVTTAPLTDDELHLLAADHGWPAGSVRTQLARDATQVPFGRGALFVPAMVDGLDEPPITVWRDGTAIAEGLSGARIVLPPGEYTVQMGSGSVGQRFHRVVQIRELRTTVLPAVYSGLTVHVVDPQLNSLRNAYEVIRMQDRVFIGVGFGVDEQAGEPVATWILRPGLYKLVRIGGNYRDRTDFATVRLLPGQHTQFLLVQDRDTGDFKGAGEARPEELFRPGRGLWAAFLLGGEASLIARRAVAGYTSGQTYDLQAFLDTKLNVEIARNPLLLRLQVNEGQQLAPGYGGWIKTQDLLQVDLLYIYALAPWLGPYLRGRAITNLFANTARFNPPEDVTLTGAGAPTVRPQLSSLSLSPPLGTIDTLYGAGLNIRVLKTLLAEATVRAGLGRSQVRYRNVLQDTSTPGHVSFDRLQSYASLGVEGTIIGTLRLTRYVILNVVLDTLVPFDRHQAVTLDIDGSVAVKLTQFASINYRLRFGQRPSYLRPAVEQDVRLRFSVEIL